MNILKDCTKYYIIGINDSNQYKIFKGRRINKTMRSLYTEKARFKTLKEAKNYLIFRG